MYVFVSRENRRLDLKNMEYAYEKCAYHRANCLFEKKILPKNRLKLTLDEAQEYGCHPCPFCSGLKGDVFVHAGSFDYFSKSKGLNVFYDKANNLLYLWTNVGFWKIIETHSGKYILWHRNYYSPEMSLEMGARGLFHRQGDVPATYSLDKIVNYIIAHDRAKEIITEDYRKLPRQTKKQKKYYAKAQKRQTKKDMQRIDFLFEQIEKERAYC